MKDQEKGLLAARLRWSGRADADRPAVAARSIHKRQSPHVLIAASDPLQSRRALSDPPRLGVRLSVPHVTLASIAPSG